MRRCAVAGPEPRGAWSKAVVPGRTKMKSRPIISRSILSLIAMASFWTPLTAAPATQDIALTTPEGRQAPTSTFQGKVVVMFFSGVQDPQCRDEFKTLNSLAERYKGKAVTVSWVSINPPGVMGNDRLKAPCGPPGSVVVLRDATQAAFKRFSKGQNDVPIVVVLDEKGQVHGDPLFGFNPDSDFLNGLAAIVDELLNQANAG